MLHLKLHVKVALKIWSKVSGISKFANFDLGTLHYIFSFHPYLEPKYTEPKPVYHHPVYKPPKAGYPLINRRYNSYKEPEYPKTPEYKEPKPYKQKYEYKPYNDYEKPHYEKKPYDHYECVFFQFFMNSNFRYMHFLKSICSSL